MKAMAKKFEKYSILLDKKKHEGFLYFNISNIYLLKF